MNLVAYTCKDEPKRENVSLTITLNHIPRSVQYLGCVRYIHKPTT